MRTGTGIKIAKPVILIGGDYFRIIRHSSMIIAAHPQLFFLNNTDQKRDPQSWVNFYKTKA